MGEALEFQSEYFSDIVTKLNTVEIGYLIIHKNHTFYRIESSLEKKNDIRFFFIL